ncbi:MAG: MipA/OmpV family protein [Burkholderiaceae bacterium]|jgi:outer membrane scaffolding protein for murein synthesis (MipA/OmpV family)|nr:MipA/OmpV family protein [Burkholderiaceae bacterium]MCZ8174851.1 MipA/OmpV family protein [Burkholderiaceae bacterium]
MACAAPTDERLDAPPAEPAPGWEGAIGLLVSHRPAFSGSDGSVTKLTPGFFLRRGRFSITNAGGFVTRRAEDVSRGVGIDLLQGARVRASVGLRWDNGRREDSAEALRGLGDIRPTMRARLSITTSPAPPWRLGLGISTDLFGRGGGYIADLSLGREWRVTGTTVLTSALGLSFAGDRYLQTWYGITPEQSARSGRPVFEPSAGLRDASASLGLRTELSRDWLLIGGIGTSRLLGDAARSPLTGSRTGWGLNAGLAWRF